MQMRTETCNGRCKMMREMAERVYTEEKTAAIKYGGYEVLNEDTGEKEKSIGRK